jgi:hypothetical protein
VTGVFGNKYASITCIATPKKVTAVIMVAGQGNSNVPYIHNKIQEKLLALPNIQPEESSQNSTNAPANPNIYKKKSSIFTQPQMTTQSPVFLFWGTTNVKTDSVYGCYQLAKSDFDKEVKDVELSKSFPDSYAALKCFKTGSSVMALISVVGNNQDSVKNRLNTLKNSVSKRTFIDGTPANPDPNIGCTLYEHRDYGGASYKLGDKDTLVMAGDSNVGGSVSNGGSISYEPWWNDKVSSFKVTDGCTLTLWQHINEGGAVFNASKSYIFVGSSWNDQASEAYCSCK